MSRKKIENLENEAKDEKFRRIANPRIKKLVYEANRLIKMTQQPAYLIFDVDAEKILEYVSPAINELLETYSKLAEGKTLKQTKEQIKDVF